MTARRTTVIVSTLFLVAALSVHLPALVPPKTQPQSQTIRLNVEMVSLPVVVTTAEGKRVLDLQKDDFQVLEDGVVQEITGFGVTDEPVSVAFALDTSGSLEGRLGDIQNEAIHFVNLLHPDDSVAIMSFAEDVQLLEDWSIDRDRNARGIKETRHGSCTKLIEAVWLALEEVLKPIQERKALVLFTDGVDTASHKASKKETVELAKETRATIYPIYFTWRGLPTAGRPTVRPFPIPGSPPIMMPPTIPPTGGGGGCGAPSLNVFSTGRGYLNELAEYSGGRVFDAQQLQDLGPAFEEIAKELSSQYSIGYYSTNKKRDGKFRRVEVKVKKAGLVARTKKGYYAPKEEKRKSVTATR
jgi:VWFA-related protein